MYCTGFKKLIQEVCWGFSVLIEQKEKGIFDLQGDPAIASTGGDWTISDRVTGVVNYNVISRNSKNPRIELTKRHSFVAFIIHPQKKDERCLHRVSGRNLKKTLHQVMKRLEK